MPLARSSQPKKKRLLAQSARCAVLVSALALAACGSSSVTSTYGGPAASVVGESERLSRSELQRALHTWEERYERNPESKPTALNFASTLRAAGRYDQAVAILRRAVLTHDNDREVLAAYARALTAAGRFEEALQVISRAHSDARPDWRLLSAQGTILDQMGRHADARQAYSEALQIVPDEPTVLSNLGMSYVLAGDLPEAERTLRLAVESGRSVDPRVRGNLALVVGLQGRFDEAMQIARQDLSPGAAEANIAYLRQMLSENDRWGQIAQSDQ
ncbi:MAG: tetratricopeptide repeat protein [Devosiaceae bacterium]|nr:tetratricopeptide repeat protein [Devosiaceae bacterium MH13]